MHSLIFIIQGSKPYPYEVKCKNINGMPMMTCTCDAAKKDMHCKHRLNLLNGDISAVIEGDIDRLPAFVATTKGTPLAFLLQEIHDLDQQKKAMEQEIKNRKKHLGMALLGRF